MNTKGVEKRMELRKIFVVLLALLLAAMVPMVSGSEGGTCAGNTDTGIIQVSIMNKEMQKI